MSNTNNEYTMPHVDDCWGGTPCEPKDAAWRQPPGSYVAEAEGQLGNGAPWCQVRDLAWELKRAEDLDAEMERAEMEEEE